MPVINDVDVLREVERSRVPPQIARHDRLGALREQALAMVGELGLAHARACWRIVALQGEPGRIGRLCLEGRHLVAPWLVPASGQLTAVACAVATLGDSLERQVSALFAGRRVSLAVALDSVGNELLFAVSRRVQDRMLAAARKQGLTVAGELRAGDPGLALEAQQTVLDLAGAVEIGLTLTRTSMMSPTKSTPIVQGVGLALPVQTWSRCDNCHSRERCPFARDAR